MSKKDILVPHAYKLVLTDCDETEEKEVMLLGFTARNAEIDAVDIYSKHGLCRAKSVKKLPSIAKYLVCFPRLAAKLL